MGISSELRLGVALELPWQITRRRHGKSLLANLAWTI